MDVGSILPLRRRRFRWLTIGFVIALVLFGLIDVRRRARIEPGNPEAHRTDLTIFTGAGAAFLQDDQPYQYANPRGWKYAYPPLCALLLSPLALLSPQNQAVLWYALSCGMAWLGWREAVRISRCVERDIRLSPNNVTPDRRLGWIAAATVALPALNCLQRGQVGILNVWLLLWGFRLLLESVTWRGAFAGGMVLALPAVIKVTPALPAVVAVGVWGLAKGRQHGWLSAWPAPVGLAVGGLLGLFVLPGTLLGWNTNLRHLADWRASILTQAVEVDPHGTLETPYTVRNQSLSNAVYRLGNFLDHSLLGGPDDRSIDAVPFNPDHHLLMDADWAARLVLALRLLVLALLGAVAWKATRSQQPAHLAAVFGLSCAASLIVSPLSRGHYFVLLLPAVLWGAEYGAAGCQRFRQQLLIWTPLVLTWLHYAALDVAGRVGLLGIGLTVWAVVASVGWLRVSTASAAADSKADVAPLSRAA